MRYEVIKIIQFLSIMKGIVCSIFDSAKCLVTFHSFLESAFIFGNLDDDTEILIHTSNSCMKLIKQSHLYNDKMVFEICDSDSNARVDILNSQSVSKYDKVLLLDINVIIIGDINKIFDACVNDISYIFDDLERGALDSRFILFNNSEQMRNIFTKKESIEEGESRAILFDEKLLGASVASYHTNCLLEKVIYYFPQNYSQSTTFFNTYKDAIIVDNIAKAKQYAACLLRIVEDCGETLEGNIFTVCGLEFTHLFVDKCKNISNLVLNKNIKKVMEIGFNSGFSTLLMLLTNPKMQITCFDIGEHKYTLPCYAKLKETFGDRIRIIIGDSTKTLPEVNEIYDLIHIDGGHSTEVANSDIENSFRLSKQGTILIMDDYDFHNLRETWDSYVSKYDLKKLDIHVYNSPHHDIKYVVK